MAIVKPRVVFVTGDDEYRGEYSMPALAAILREQSLETTICLAKPTPRTPDNIEGLEALARADLAVFFLRWRRLPEEQLRHILRYVDSGKPAVGFRTATHSFLYPAGHPRHELNDGFPLRVFGAKWTRHHGHLSTTRTTLAAKHPVLNGVDPELTLPSWLYTVNPLQGDCRPLLTGHAINPQNGRDDGPQPLAWVKTHKGGRVFFTTAGHPEDFHNANFRRLTVNGIRWALGLEIPPEGSPANWVTSYNPPPSGIPAPKA